MKSNGGIFGKPNITTTQSASGIWSLNDVRNKIIDSSWPYLLSFDGSSLSGWTSVGATVNSTEGNPLPSLQALGGQYAYIDVGSSLLGKTIEFDIFVISGTNQLSNLFFAVNSSGAGQQFRLECRAANNSGFASTTSWTLWDAPTAAPNYSANTWYNIKIQITSAGLATVLLNNTAIQSNYSITNNGNIIAIHGDGDVVTGGRYDNIKIY
jgi:hypothetical protein